VREESPKTDIVAPNQSKGLAMSFELTRTIHRDESGHAASVLGALPAAAGAIMLGFGAANDTGWLAIAGGIIAGLGIVIYDVVRHATIDWGTYARLDRLDSGK